MKKYALVKDGTVENVILFDDDVSDETLTKFKELHLANEIINIDEHPAAMIGGTWDGSIFTTPDGKVNEDWANDEEVYRIYGRYLNLQ